MRSESVVATAGYVVSHPWEVFVERWNWKAAVLSAAFRGLAFALPVGALVREDAARTILIEIVFRLAIGGFWGALLQAFRAARPAWLAGLSVAIFLPGAAHFIEFAALRASRVSHVRTGMTVSVVISIGSLLINWGLMRRGLLITGEGADTLQSDLRRVPSAIAAFARSVWGARSS